ncbi:hypothetical protein [Undibacterium sp. Ji49W]|uniref:hypothetical protein n=1 Tax=Undibacterium sp. Ji49W TaxID=3413040 RepID=UPI003BF3F886
MTKILPFLLFFLPLLGQAGQAQLEMQADKLRNAAMAAFEKGHDQQAALKLNKRALRVSRHLPASSWRTIENYDDAGLYYYENNQWKASAQHQAIAVLLACGVEESQPMFAVYVKRLGFAFSKYRPGQDFAPIAANPLVLLEDIPLNLRGNADLRRRYFDTIRLKTDKSGARYLYKLKRQAVPASCYFKPETAQSTSMQSE